MLTSTEGTGKNNLGVGLSQRPNLIGYADVFNSSYIINYSQGLVDQKATHLAYFYLNYRDAEKQSVQNLLTSLICQLALFEPTLSVQLIASYEAHEFGATRPSYAECTHLLRCAVSRCAKIFLVIDAFDEYPEERRSQLLWHPYIYCDGCDSVSYRGLGCCSVE